MLGTIIMLYTLQQMSKDKQKEVEQAFKEGKVEAKDINGIKYLLWKND